MVARTEPRLVALRLEPGPRFWNAVVAAWDDGDAILPLPVRAPRRETAALLAELRPHRVVDDSGVADLEDPRPTAPGVALVIATSGTTGPPRGVEITGAALEASAAAADERLGATADDRWLCCVPVSHIAGFQVLLRSHLRGRVPAVHPRFDAHAVAAERDVTLVSLVPTMLQTLLEEGVDVGRFKAVLLGGAPLPPELLKRARAAGANIVRSYGMTETSGGCVYDGLPLDGVDVAVDSGRICIRGRVLARGYRARPELTKQAFVGGWFRSADVGELDADGRLRVLGRADGVIISGGEKVNPAEVATALRAHPAVADAHVFGKPDSRWGQRVAAVVVPPAGTELPSLDHVRAFLAGRLAPHKIPTEVIAAHEPGEGSGARGPGSQDAPRQDSG